MSQRDEEIKLARTTVFFRKKLTLQAQKVVDGLIEETRKAELHILTISRHYDELCYRCYKRKSQHGLEHRIAELLDPKKPVNCKKCLYNPRTGLIPVVGPCGVSKTKCKG